MIAFKKGLDPGLLKACFARRPQPLLLQDWFDAAAEEEKIFDEQQFAVDQAKQRRGWSTREMARDADRRRQNRGRGRDIDPRPYDPMNVDAAKTQRLSLEERAKLIQDGKCFWCKKQGHMYRECPTRPKGPPRGKKRPKGKERRSARPRARAAEASGSNIAQEDVDHPSDADEESDAPSTRTAPPAYSKSELMTAIKAMKTQERDELIETLTMHEDSDF
jgi:hypothetical protein